MGVDTQIMGIDTPFLKLYYNFITFLTTSWLLFWYPRGNFLSSIENIYKLKRFFYI